MKWNVKHHEKYMKHGIELAKNGLGHVSPNPMVGAVIVRSGEIIAEGYHTKFGMAHAEVEALKAYKDGGYRPSDADVMYVTLEPCNHFGKTPPCTDAIIKSGIKTVVVAMTDPNPLVAGTGIQKLRDSGIKVFTGVLEEEAKRLNKVFIKNMVTKMPHCTAKWAMTLDGKMATDSSDSQWISGKPARELVHKWRAECDAVLIGRGTAIQDNPRLNVRLVKGENPYRVIIDSKAKLPLGSNLVVCSDPYKTIVVSSELAESKKIDSLRRAGVEVVVLKSKEGKVDLVKAFEYLASKKNSRYTFRGWPYFTGGTSGSGTHRFGEYIYLCENFWWINTLSI